MDFKFYFLSFILLASQPSFSLTKTNEESSSKKPSSSSGQSFGPITSSSSGASSKNSSSQSSSDSLNKSADQSSKASNASSNASLSIPGRNVAKVPGHAVAVSSAVEEYIQIKKGWIVSYAYKIFDETKPTLILMPGIFRGLEKEEESLRSLEALKLNFVSIHFSTHNKSISLLKANEAPYFDGGAPNLTPAKFAHEVEAVYNQINIQKPIVVSLSYSAVVVPYLNSALFPVVVEMAPMGRPDEDNLFGAASQKAWEQWFTFNPFFGPAYVEAAKNQYQHTVWSSVVNFLKSQMPSLEDETVFNRQVDGFVSMTFAADDFDITKTNFKNGFKMAWIVGESEDPSRAYFQSEAIKKYLKSLDKDTLENSIFGSQGVIIIKGSGHVIPSDQPALYASALKEIVKKADKENVFSK